MQDEEAKFLVNQGGVLAPNGDVCCLASNPGQCQVQLSHNKGTRYFDLTNQRERFEDVLAKQTVIDFYGSVHKCAEFSQRTMSTSAPQTGHSR